MTAASRPTSRSAVSRRFKTATTKALESMISIVKTTTRNVKRWRDDKMIKRWVAAGMLNAERSFRRVKGVNDMPTLLAALAHHVNKLKQEAADDTALTA